MVKNSEYLSELELEILQLGEPTRPFTTPSSSPKRPRSSSHNGSPDHYKMQTNEEDNKSENEEDIGAPSPKKRRCSSRTKAVKAARSEALQTLTIQTKSKPASKPRQIEGALEKSKQPQYLQKQKKLRRLPVNELVTVSQRFDNSDLERHNSRS